MMRKTTAGLVMVTLLAACSGRNSADAVAGNAAQAGSVADDDSIECATAGGDFARDCTVARAETDRGLVLTASHPDGHFHRLLVTTDGRGVVAADGAQRARVTMLGPDRIEVALAGDRYRLPAHQGAAGH